MGFTKLLQSLFGNKSTRDMRLIQPIVEKVKAVYPEIEALDNDALRAKTKEIQQYVQDSAKEQKEKVAELKSKIEDTPIDEREVIFNQIDKIEKEILEIYEGALNEVLPVAFSIRPTISTVSWPPPRISSASKTTRPSTPTIGKPVATK